MRELGTQSLPTTLGMLLLYYNILKTLFKIKATQVWGKKYLRVLDIIRDQNTRSCSSQASILIGLQSHQETDKSVAEKTARTP